MAWLARVEKDMARKVVRKRHALLIGIDEYPNFPRAARLAGAKADAECLGALLIDRFEFASDDVELLLNAQATRKGIVAALGRMLERVGPGEVVWLHFSGYGSLRGATINDGLLFTMIEGWS